MNCRTVVHRVNSETVSPMFGLIFEKDCSSLVFPKSKNLKSVYSELEIRVSEPVNSESAEDNCVAVKFTTEALKPASLDVKTVMSETVNVPPIAQPQIVTSELSPRG